ncbi:uncharacterized protein LOC132725620 [Ruditapes philippinarum]|uniref:uncharacterized protein LOC132725620 n=1 Tax=Ruditapes philippinarum TaxID=129788 RepID=UPI00295BDA24|nr:uncharacterized protein LOC132725620 [Ruditapes philippinarum]
MCTNVFKVNSHWCDREEVSVIRLMYFTHPSDVNSHWCDREKVSVTRLMYQPYPSDGITRILENKKLGNKQARHSHQKKPTSIRRKHLIYIQDWYLYGNVIF